MKITRITKNKHNRPIRFFFIFSFPFFFYGCAVSVLVHFSTKVSSWNPSVHPWGSSNINKLFFPVVFFHSAKGSSNFHVSGAVWSWPFKWKLLSSSFVWGTICCSVQDGLSFYQPRSQGFSLEGGKGKREKPWERGWAFTSVDQSLRNTSRWKLLRGSQHMALVWAISWWYLLGPYKVNSTFT